MGPSTRRLLRERFELFRDGVRAAARSCVRTGPLVGVLPLIVTACQSAAPAPQPPGAPAPASNPSSAPGIAAPTASAPRPMPPAPGTVDLRPRLLALGLPPRAQGARGTCSIFTTCCAIEYALRLQDPHAPRLSPEYLNWAASQAAGRPSDGNFFHNALAGFDRFGICADELMPYQPGFDASRAPSPAAAADAAATLKRLQGGWEATQGGMVWVSRGGDGSGVAVHWIVPWVPDRFGVNEQQFAEIRRALACGYPVAAGSGHSRLLVGYRDDPARPGGGTFITEDSALARFDEVTYEFVRKEVADVFWVEALGPVAAEPDGLAR